MYLRKIKRPQGIYLAIQESYYDSTSKQSRTRTVQSLGYLDALKKEYDDPVAYFTNKAAEMTRGKKEAGRIPLPLMPQKKWLRIRMT